MQGFGHPAFYAGLMLVAGLGIPIMAALNAGLGGKLQSPTLATTILFVVALLIASVYLVVVEGTPSQLYVAETPWYYYLGGFFVVFYILTITWVAPKFGVANAVAFVLVGQLIAISVIDHFGFFGAQQYTITLKRLIGLLLMVVGVFMVLGKQQSQ